MEPRSLLYYKLVHSLLSEQERRIVSVMLGFEDGQMKSVREAAKLLKKPKERVRRDWDTICNKMKLLDPLFQRPVKGYEKFLESEHSEPSSKSKENAERIPRPDGS